MHITISKQFTLKGGSMYNTIKLNRNFTLLVGGDYKVNTNMLKAMFILSFVCLFFLGSNRAKAQFTQNSALSLFSDVKAYKSGDALMVFIVEDTQADNSASTGTSRGTNLGAGLNLRAGNPSTSIEAGLNTDNQFSANGKTARNEKIRAKISARVINTEPNGNLIIEGKRTTKVNGETQTITINGVVRPVDILANNSVYSYNVLDLALIIEGDGSITEVQEPGLITKFLRLLF